MSRFEQEPADLKRARRVKTSDRIMLDRMPPHSPEAEQGVLGCCLMSPNECLGEVIKKNLVIEAFYDLRHQEIWKELLEMFNERIPVDVITLQQRLKDKQILGQCGGIDYLSQLQDSVPSAANLDYYLAIVQEKYLLRKMIQACTETVGKIYDYEGEVDSLLDEVERDILAIRPRKQNQHQEIGELVQGAIKIIDDLHNSRGQVTGLSTGFVDLDGMTNGLHGSEFTLISALPSFGKTSLGMNIVENVVLNLKKPCAVFTLEMTATQLVSRIISSLARVDLMKVWKHGATDEEFKRIRNEASRLVKSKIFFHDVSDTTVYEIRAIARSWWQRHGIEMILVDYLQLLKAPAIGKHFRSSTEETAEVSQQLKSMAREFNLPVIAISSLTEDGNGKTKLRNSGDIRYDGDNIYKIRFATKEEKEKYGVIDEGILVVLEIQKQRNRPTGKIYLVFLKKYTRFENASPVNDEDVPTE